MQRPLIALLTDFGTKDHYVGVMKGVMKRICPEAEFIDITHSIPPQDVRAAAYMLATNYQYFPEETIFLVVVDPGVGLQRKPIAVAAGGYTFIAPDNGVLSYMLAQEKLQLATEIIMPLLNKISYTFHGRDVFAPAAAMVADGAKLHEIGTVIHEELNHYPKPKMKVRDGVVSGEVLYIDHFGNIVSSIGSCIWETESILELQSRFYPQLDFLRFDPESQVVLDDVTLGHIHHTYGDVKRGELLALIGSSDFLEVAVNQGNAAKRLDIKIGDPVTLTIKPRWD